METAINNFLVNFTSIVYEAMPFIILGAILAGIMEEMVPARWIARIVPRNRFLSIAMGGVLGLIFPMCECGIVAVMRRLLRKGVPLSCCTAYMLAGPIINVVVMMTTWQAFRRPDDPKSLQILRESGQLTSLPMTCWRIGLGFVIAVTTSLIVDWQHRKYGSKLLTPLTQPTARDDEKTSARRASPWQRLSNICETTLADFVDITAFLILGALLAAAFHLWLDKETVAELARQHIVPAILIMMGLAVLLCLCSEADAFVAASFSTLPPAAKLAFLVLGPMMDLKLYFFYRRVFNPG